MIPIAHIALPVLAVTSFTSTETTVAPIATLALLLDAAIVGIWYMLGVMLNNSTVKAAARSEVFQLVGTIVLIAVIVGSLGVFGKLFYSIGNGTALLGSSSISSLCSGLESNSPVALLNPNVNLFAGSPVSFLSSFGSFPGLCSMVDMQSSPTLTQQIDYPLAASGVVIANLTNQTATQLDQTFVVDAWLGFLAHAKPTLTFCFFISFPSPISAPCIIPNPVIAPMLEIRTSDVPYAGLEMIYKSLSGLGMILTTAYEAFVAQLTATAIFTFIWPYLLFAGIAFRSTFFTRRIGGLLIAIAVGGVLFYPALFSLEYLALGHGLGSLTGFAPQSYTYSTNSVPSAYGYNTIFTSNVLFIPATSNGDVPYITNYYVLPSLQPIAEYHGCWPGVGQYGTGTGNLFVAELEVMAYLDLGGSLIQDLSTITSSYVPNLLNGIEQCNESNAKATLFGFMKVYGIDGVTAYFLPIINLMVVLAGIIGLSGLMGGDTQLAGLAKFV